MKALTNILTRLLMLMLLMLVACTEETAEVDNLTRGEQYVQVRMHVPGMTAAATRAADDVIESVTALAFDTNGSLLKVVSATNITTERFNLTVPNGTKNIHFLANYNGDLSAVQKEIDLTTLTTTDYNNLVYWGMTTYEGTTNTLSTTLYRNMAKITLAPDEEFPFDGELTIAGLDNPNTSGTLIPYNNGFHNTGVAPTYLTLPDGVETLDETPIGNDGAGYGNSLYVFEHANSNYMDKGLFVFCKIGDAYYSVALTRDGVTPYEIKRNHEYIIYVSDVDDYQTNDYRAERYDALFDGEGKTVKKPINLEVKEVESVTFNASAQSIDVDGNLTVTMTVPEEGTVTALTISAPGFTIKQGESYIGNGLNIVGNSTVTYTFVPNTFGKGKEITFTASGTNLQETEQTISVNVTAAIYAGIENNSTLYYDQDNQTVTVNVTMPKGLSAISIGGAGNFMVTPPAQGTFNNNVYTRAEATTTQEVQFVFTLDKSKYTSQQGNTSATFTFSDASTENASDKATSASVNNISLIPTPVLTFTPSAETIYLNGGTPNSLNVTMNGNSVPNNAIVSLTITAPDFTITAQNGTTLSQDGNVWTYNGTLTTLVFTPASAGKKPISIAGNGENIKVTGESFEVTVKASITATALSSKIYYDGDNKDVTVRVTIPKGVSGLEIVADDFTVKQGETPLTYDETKGAYTYSRGDATTQVDVDFVFTLKDGVTADSSITFSDASGNDNVDDDEVVIDVEATPVQGEEDQYCLFESTDGVNVVRLLRGNNSSMQITDSVNTDYTDYIQKGARIIVNFIFNCTYDWHMQQAYVKMKTDWNATFVTQKYSETDTSISFTIDEGAMNGGENGYDSNTKQDCIKEAGFLIEANYALIKSIYVIPAPTIE